MLVFNAMPSSIQAAHVHDIYTLQKNKKQICCFNYRVVTVVAVKLN